ILILSYSFILTVISIFYSRKKSLLQLLNSSLKDFDSMDKNYFSVNLGYVLLDIVTFAKPATQSSTGTFKITEKAPNPGGVFGTSWIRLYKDYGIHGTNNPASIGKAVSNGCIRMYTQDANYVYSLAPIGTEVNVVSSQTTARYNVVQPGDTLFSISQKLRVSYDALLRENTITDP
ncbi:L,D-transpeptidase family protein, partial [Anaerosolibacter sp.]|uniref:L,D-transpeptidase family protein n=1 Tax=Anaerosolibacter sp. TaxID=1872527 RepID=UPI0039F0C8EF